MWPHIGSCPQRVFASTQSSRCPRRWRARRTNELPFGAKKLLSILSILNNGSNIIKPWALAHGFMILEPLFKQNVSQASSHFLPYLAYLSLALASLIWVFSALSLFAEFLVQDIHLEEGLVFACLQDVTICCRITDMDCKVLQSQISHWYVAILCSLSITALTAGRNVNPKTDSRWFWPDFQMACLLRSRSSCSWLFAEVLSRCWKVNWTTNRVTITWHVARCNAWPGAVRLTMGSTDFQKARMWKDEKHW